MRAVVRRWRIGGVLDGMEDDAYAELVGAAFLM